MEEQGVKQTFGQAFRTFRQQKGISQSGLAHRSGIAVRTIGYWEAGERLPRTPELQATLQVLGATSQETARLADLLTTPRALRLVTTGNSASDPPPGLGELLRAMRLRCGLTQGALAEKLNVTRHSVLRWETMQNVINDENLFRLCHLLRAAPEEQEALKMRRLPLPSWEPQGSLSLDDLAQVWHEVHVANSPLRDLYALTLKRHLRLYAQEDMGAIRLLGLIEKEHGVWLDSQERIVEAKGCIERALLLMQQDHTPQPYWSAALNLATYYAQKSSGEKASLRLLHDWFPRLPHGNIRAYQFCDMAVYCMMAGHSAQAANIWLSDARRMFFEDADTSPGDISYWQVSYARVQLMSGHRVQNHSIELFEKLLADSPSEAIRFMRLLILARTLVQYGEQPLAMRYLSQAQHALTAETPPKLRRLFAEVSSLF